ncbi:uncharacterized protein [Choristoneura fumiferana]|uniref:uncharacterized protein n=1 Tax=Choristoneura fumiferana TaxID=7141 RepID=UPI003D155327
MSGAAPARPLSGGLWTLISWLRRDDAGSSDSLSSVGSDRTVASFSFLSPERCRLRPAPLLLPPPGPPTDSYKKRVRDRNARLQHDRDLTLHRKYGLYRGETTGYDAFSLPSARKVTNENRERHERERRAASECLQRRAAHVPGKRRAPPPPSPPLARAATLGARRPRKRPAPPPPDRHLHVIELNATIPEDTILTQMSAKLGHDNPPSPKNDSSDCKPEKNTKKDVKDKDSKKPEKSFLKQIFENRKRNSVIETIPDRILPSISELDKQAAEIIESCKLKALNRGDEHSQRESPTRSKGDKWFCTRCLRKYDDSVVTCVHCLTEQKMKLNKSNAGERSSPGSATKYRPRPDSCVASSSGLTEAEEKQKLKDMLKEMKDSLPKRAKHDIKSTNNLNNNLTAISKKNPVTDAATLRIGSKMCEEENNSFVLNVAPKEIREKASTNNDVIRVEQDSKPTSATEMALVTQPIVLQHSPSRDIVKLEKFKVQANVSYSKAVNKDNTKSHVTQNENPKELNISAIKKLEVSSSNSNNLHMPLKISSLLNSSAPQPESQTRKSIFFSQTSQQSHPTNQNELNVPRPQNPPPAKPSNDNSKPALSLTSIMTGTTINSQQSLSHAAAAVVTKVAHNESSVPKEQPMPKVQSSVKTTSTTQTSSETLLESASKSKPNSKNCFLDNKLNDIKNLLETSTPKKSDTTTKMATVGISLSVTSSNGTPNVISSPSNNLIINTIATNAITTENLQLETKKDKDQPQKIDRKISTGLLRSEVPQKSIEHQNILQGNNSTKLVAFDQHSRRRDLINQLEQSIAKGDERAAAEAAAKLAQLRLSCSVLSFSSQIVGAPSTSFSGNQKKDTHSVSTSDQINQIIAASPVPIKQKTRVNDNLQSASAKAITASSTKISEERKITSAPLKSAGSECQKLSPNNRRKTLNEPSTSKQNEGVGNENDGVSIDVWIEDREAARGPVKMNIPRSSVMGDLRRQADASLGLAARLQRWIVGRTLCTDDNTPLQALAGPGFDAPFYLCLVEPESNKNSSSPLEVFSTSASPKKENSENNLTDVYSELVLLERRALVPNTEEFECGVCMEHYTAGQGAILRECVHTFCRDCLTDVVKHCEEPAISCPAMGCPGNLQEREIRALVSPEDYERWLARGLAAAESGTRNAFHCRTRDCTGWALCETGVTRFPCPVCKKTNCVSCQAIHEGDTCEQYRSKQAAEAPKQAPDQTDEGTRAFLDTLISRGEALECPECSAIITKKWGCDWIKCSACKTEICWVTRGRRWGPGGRGDTSAGCRCGVDGKRCHPSCGYCH